MFRAAVIDYGMSNLGSVRRALEECGASVKVCSTPDDLDGETRIILPGVGSFADGISNLKERGWVERLPVLLQDPDRALLGICLGMQLMASSGTEGGERLGLDLIPGRVVRLEPGTGEERIPHVGWNEIRILKSLPLLKDIESGTDFYFVHSYHFACTEEAAVAATSYGGGFVSVVGQGNVFGTQFHPEKSSRPGFILLRNFLSQKLLNA